MSSRTEALQAIKTAFDTYAANVGILREEFVALTNDPADSKAFEKFARHTFESRMQYEALMNLTSRFLAIDTMPGALLIETPPEQNQNPDEL